MDRQDHPNSEAAQAATRRRRRRYMLGGLAVLVLLIVAAPSWVPARWAGARLAAAMSGRLGRPVRIDTAMLGWSSGVIIEGIELGAQAEETGTPLPNRSTALRVGRLAFELAPWRWLDKSVGTVHAEDVEIWLDADADLSAWTSTATRKDGGVSIDGLDTQHVVMHLLEHRSGVRTDVRLARLTYGVDRDSGTVTWRLDGRMTRIAGDEAVEAGTFVSEGSLSVPQINPAVTLDGQGRFRWTSVDLGAIPPAWLEQVGTARLTGSSSGTVDVAMTEALETSVALSATCKGLTLDAGDADQLSRIDSLAVDVAGDLSPTADRFVVRRFECRTPGAWVQGTADDAPVAVVTWREGQPLSAQVTGQVTDWPALGRAFPAVGAILADVEIDGQCDLRADWQRAGDTDAFDVSITADDLQWSRPGVMSSDATGALAVDVSGRYARRGRELTITRAAALLGPTHVVATGQAVLPASDTLADALSALHGLTQLDIQIRDADLATLHTRWPILRRTCGPADLSGSGVVHISQDPGPAGIVRCDLTLPAESSIAISDFIDKPVGAAFNASAWLALPTRDATIIERYGAAFTCNGGSLRLVGVEPLQYTAHVGDDDRPTLDASCAMTVTCQGVESLLATSPAARTWLADRLGEADIAGGFEGGVEATVTAMTDTEPIAVARANMDARFTFDALAVAVDGPTAFGKASGEPCVLGVTYALDATTETPVHCGSAEWQASGVTGQATGQWRAEGIDGRVEIEAEDIVQAVAWWPEAAMFVARHDLTGRAAVAGHLRNDPSGQTLSLDVNADGLTLPQTDDVVVCKPIDAPMRLSTTLRLPATPDATTDRLLTVERLDAQLGGCVIQGLTGRIALAGGDDATGWPMSLEGTWQLQADDRMGEMVPAVREIIDRHALAGAVRGTTRVTTDGRRIHVAGSIDATDLSVSALPNAAKCADTPLRMAFDVTARLDRRDNATTGATIDIDQVDVHLANADVRVTDAAVTLARTDSDRDWELRSGEAVVAVDMPDLASLAEVVPLFEQMGVRGLVSGCGVVTVADGQVHTDAFNLHATDAELVLSGDLITVSGDLALGDGILAADQIAVTTGSSSMTLSGHAEHLAGDPTVQLMVYSDTADIDELLEIIHTATARASDGQPSGGDTDTPAPAWLTQGLFNAQVHLSRAKVTDPKSRATVTLDEVVANATLGQGRLSATFLAAMGGGVVQGQTDVDLVGAPRYMNLYYQAQHVQPRPEIVPLVQSFFPGMEISGPITMTEHSRQRLDMPDGLPSYPTGDGSIVIDGGGVAGRAAPMAVARIFPGLNMVRFDFTRMLNWFTKQPDGRTRNRMIFIGSPYNLYMDGYSGADNRIQYEVGIDMLADLESRQWVERRQGRVPLFNKTGDVGPDGNMLNEIVRYLTPTQILKHIARDNVVRTAYYALMDQLRKAKQP